MSMVDFLSDAQIRRTLNTDPSFERLRYLIVLTAASEPPFDTAGTLIGARVTFNVMQLSRVAGHLGLDFERFRGAARVYSHLEAAGLVGSVENEETRHYRQYYPTETGFSQARLNIDRLSKISDLSSQAKTMQMTIRKQMATQAEAVIELVLREGVISIGRDDNNDYAIDDRYMSSKHAKIVYMSGQWIIEDLNSKNGSWKVGPRGLERISRMTINDGDEFQLGSTVFRFRHPSAKR